MQNSNSTDGTEVPQSTEADVTTSSQTIAKPLVVRSPLIRDYLHLYLGCNIFIDSQNVAFNKDILDLDLLERLYNDLPIEMYKPILRTTQSVTQEEWDEAPKSSLHIGIEGCFYSPELFKYLLELKIDLFGLIDNGLAIEDVSER